jgi:hypothetical protein
VPLEAFFMAAEVSVADWMRSLRAAVICSALNACPVKRCLSMTSAPTMPMKVHDLGADHADVGGKVHDLAVGDDARSPMKSWFSWAAVRMASRTSSRVVSVSMFPARSCLL